LKPYVGSTVGEMSFFRPSVAPLFVQTEVSCRQLARSGLGPSAFPRSAPPRKASGQHQARWQQGLVSPHTQQARDISAASWRTPADVPASVVRWTRGDPDRRQPCREVLRRRRPEAAAQQLNRGRTAGVAPSAWMRSAADDRPLACRTAAWCEHQPVGRGDLPRPRRAGRDQDETVAVEQHECLRDEVRPPRATSFSARCVSAE
jgi:hypothetical protein